MRSYTNKEGLTIEVSEQHLLTAVKIKKELQKASPSRKASWKQLVKMMEVEGFYDAENSEAYRCMIKAYQKKIGELPEVQKYADMVSNSKLESIKELVSEISYEKRENQHYLREINKGKRELIDFGLMVEQITNALENYDWSKLKIEPYEILEVSEKKMIVNLSDLHIGALVDVEGNTYNFNKAIERMSVYASKILAEADKNDITDLYIMNLGDTVEHALMRFSQGFEAEFNFSEQINKASDLIIKFISYFALKGFNVKYAGIAGNHDRISDKDKNIDGDHAVNLINNHIKIYLKGANLKNVEFVEADSYKHGFSFGGKNILAVHGDLDSKNDANLLSKHSTLDDVDYDIVLMGHFHTREIKELANNKFLCVCGSLKGFDNYSLNKLRKMSPASQTVVIIDEHGEIDFKWFTFN